MYNNAAIENKRAFDLKKVFLDKLRSLVFILILASFSSGVLMGVSAMIPLDQEGLDLESKLLILRAFAIESGTDNIEQTFQENVAIDEVEGLTLYRSNEGSIAFEFTGRGHMAPITALVALAPDLKTIEGLVILEQQETPGLGGRIAEGEFLDQFKGLALNPEPVILPAGRAATADHEVEGITGATLTTKALEAMLTQSIQEVMQKLEVN